MAKFKCNKCGNHFYDSIKHGECDNTAIHICPYCGKKSGIRVRDDFKKEIKKRHNKPWDDGQRRWVRLAVIEAGNNLPKAIELLQGYREKIGEEVRVPNMKQLTGLVRGSGFDALLDTIAEDKVLSKMLELLKSDDEKVSGRTAEYLMDRAKGKATQRIEKKVISISLSDQSAEARKILQQRKKERSGVWTKEPALPCQTVNSEYNGDNNGDSNERRTGGQHTESDGEEGCGLPLAGETDGRELCERVEMDIEGMAKKSHGEEDRSDETGEDSVGIEGEHVPADESEHGEQ